MIERLKHQEQEVNKFPSSSESIGRFYIHFNLKGML